MGRSLGIGTWLAEPLDFEVPSNGCIFGGLAAGQTLGTSAPVLHFCSGKPQKSGTTGKKWWSNFQQGTRALVSLKKNKAVRKFDPDSNERIPERVLGWTWVAVLTWAVLSCYSNGHCWLLEVVKPWTGNSHDAPESEDIWRARQQILTSTAKIRSHCTKFAGTARHLCETKTVALVWSQSKVLNIFGWRVESDFHRHPLETSWPSRRSIPGWFLERLESKWR